MPVTKMTASNYDEEIIRTVWRTTYQVFQPVTKFKMKNFLQHIYMQDHYGMLIIVFSCGQSHHTSLFCSLVRTVYRYTLSPLTYFTILTPGDIQYLTLNHISLLNDRVFFIFFFVSFILRFYFRYQALVDL